MGFAASTGQAAMGSRLTHYRNRPHAELSRDVRNYIRNRHFVFVTGYMNELAGLSQFLRLHPFGYFEVTADLVKEYGGSATVYNPKSLETITDSGKKLALNMFRLFAQGEGRPIVVVGHSRGGTVAISSMIENPDLIDKNFIDRVVTIQSPVGGNDLPLMGVSGTLSRVLLPSDAGLLGIASLTSEKIEDAIGSDRISRLSPRQRAVLDDHILWFASSKPNDSPASFIEDQFGRQYSFLRDIPNDRVLPTHNMVRSDFGSALGYAPDLSHLQPVMGTNDSNGKSDLRAFSFALFESIYRSTQIGQDQSRSISDGVMGAIKRGEIENSGSSSSWLNRCARLLSKSN